MRDAGTQRLSATTRSGDLRWGPHGGSRTTAPPATPSASGGVGARSRGARPARGCRRPRRRRTLLWHHHRCRRSQRRCGDTVPVPRRTGCRIPRAPLPRRRSAPEAQQAPWDGAGGTFVEKVAAWASTHWSCPPTACTASRSLSCPEHSCPPGVDLRSGTLRRGAAARTRPSRCPVGGSGRAHTWGSHPSSPVSSPWRVAPDGGRPRR